MDKYLAFLEKVKETRKKKGLSQEDMAKRLGINKIAYNRLENGKTKLGFDRVYDLIEIFGVDFIYELDNKVRPQLENELIEKNEKKIKELEKQIYDKQLLIDLMIDKLNSVGNTNDDKKDR